MRSSHSHTLWSHACVLWGAVGVATCYTEGWEGKGLRVGTRDHSCPKQWVCSRVGLRINQEALATGDRNPSQSSLGHRGFIGLRNKKKIQELDQHQAGSKGVLGTPPPPFLLTAFFLVTPELSQAPPTRQRWATSALLSRITESSLASPTSLDKSCRITYDRLCLGQTLSPEPLAESVAG